jgi:hypothetical protein
LSAGNLKAAKRTFPFDLKADEIQLALHQPQYDHTQKAKRPRFEKPLSTSKDDATIKNTSHATIVALPPPDVADQADSDPVKDIRTLATTHPGSESTT